jgi:Uma2 family endonuclease
MATTTKLSFEDFQKLPEREGTRYELDEGTLLMEPSPTFFHNRVRDRIARRLSDFVEGRDLGEVTVELDFRLGRDIVRNPDVALVTTDHLRRIDINSSPVDGAPILAVEVISPSNTAQDTAKKVRQYLSSGSRSVWLVYPSLKLVEIHSAEGTKTVESPAELRDEVALPGFSLPLEHVFRT